MAKDKTTPKNLKMLKSYPSNSIDRKAVFSVRSVKDKYVAAHRDARFFDGSRREGYGGLIYDGRWVNVAKDFCDVYELTSDSSVLQINCEKAFLLYEFELQKPGIKILGTETSEYALKNVHPKSTGSYFNCAPSKLPFDDDSIDLVLALGVLYTLSISDFILAVREINRISCGRSFITLASYSSVEDLEIFKSWSLLGNLIFRENEWVELLKLCDYTGAYDFVSSASLGLLGNK
jgi:hypothetical protein